MATLPLLRIPMELRLLIYDQLFQPLAVRPEHADTYMLPNEWPKHDFTSYRNLRLTCRQLCAEATDHFTAHYLQYLTLYFDSVPALYDFACGPSNELPQAVHDNIRVSLRMQPFHNKRDKGKEERAVYCLARFTGYFMLHQPGMAMVYERVMDGFTAESLGRLLSDEAHEGFERPFAVGETLPTRHRKATGKHSRDSIPVNVLRFPHTPKAKVRITAHQVAAYVDHAFFKEVGPLADTTYMEMTGRLADLQWDSLFEYDNLKTMRTFLRILEPARNGRYFPYRGDEYGERSRSMMGMFGVESGEWRKRV